MPEKSGPRRPFATGSKPGPDAVDHYLEEQGFYRKHVARDASSLFRSISEQVFDIQNFHDKLRQDCVAYMEERVKEYSNEVDKNFYNYLHQLRRTRTYGSLLELRVMARMYRKNVILFEPTQNLQTTSSIYVQNDDYDSVNPLRVFYSHKDKHFDVIYTMDYVERLAECQAVVYSLLYTDVYKLPDVQYAVERMLHDQEEQMTLPLVDDPSKYVTQAGDVIPFDSHDQTNCVLADPRTCHFHNQVDFEDVVNDHKDAITVVNRTDDPGRLKIFKPVDGFLYASDKSCVRQLLDERITPFPYKVAKALDSSIYRNTEFELWSENRKEQRLKWLDSHSNEKWLIYDYNNYRRPSSMRKHQDVKHERAVVDEKSYMALDDEMKKKYIILDPSVESFKLHQLTDLNHFVPSKESLELTVMPINTHFPRAPFKGRRGGGRYSNNHGNNPHHFGYNQQYHNNGGGSGHQNQQSQVAYVSEIERDANTQPPEQLESQVFYPQQQQPTQVYGGYQETCNYEQQSAPPPAFYHQMPPPPSWNNQLVPYIPAQQVQYATPLNYQQIMPYGNFTIPPPPATIVQAPESSGDLMNIMRESELSSSAVSWKPIEAVEHNGADLPMDDLPTLQFYYNLGVRYYLASGVQRRPKTDFKTVAHHLEALNLNESSQNALDSENVNEQEAAKVDAPPVPTNTPVTTKPIGGSFGPPQGSRYHNSNHNNYRRPFGSSQNSGRENNRDGSNYRGNYNSNHPRKEIKFNSNVKNAHKVDTKAVGNQHSNIHSVQSQTFHASAGPMSSTGSTKMAESNNEASPNVKNNQEKTSPTALVPQFSPISPIVQESSQMHYQQQQQIPMMPIVDGAQVQQYYQPYPAQQPFIPQQQPGVTMVYQITEDGGYMMHQVQQPIQYQQQPYPYQLQPQTPVFYPVQNFPQPVMDGSSGMSSNDSGMVDPNSYHQQQPMQFYPQPQFQVPPPVPLFYTPTLPQTPQIAHIAPLYPVPQQIQTAPPQQAPVAAVTPQAAEEPPETTQSDESAVKSGKST